MGEPIFQKRQAPCEPTATSGLNFSKRHKSQEAEPPPNSSSTIVENAYSRSMETPNLPPLQSEPQEPYPESEHEQYPRPSSTPSMARANFIAQNSGRPATMADIEAQNARTDKDTPATGLTCITNDSGGGQRHDREESGDAKSGSDKSVERQRTLTEKIQPVAKMPLCPAQDGLQSKGATSSDKLKQGIGQTPMEPRSSAADATSGSEIQRSDAKDRSSMSIELQPETRPISLSQLVNEVKGIYVGLVMVETKCIEVDSEKGGVGSNPQTKFTDEQWQALITLHRTLLHEHHDFMLASQHPSASPALRRLAIKYAMPARMWRHGIHSFLELLRHRLPDSQEHMITFIYLAYSMMALLYETVPAFEDTWVECLGDLSRYRMAIEDDNQRVRDTWTQVSAGWYTIASNHAPTTGRLYHHLAILARPQIVTQLYLYLKSLCVPVPFSSTNESILTLLDPILNNKPPAGISELEVLFVTLHAILFTGKSNSSFATISAKFLKALDSHITTGGKSLIETGVYIAIINICAVLGFGADNNVLMKLLRQPKTSSTNAIDGTSNADLRSIEESSSAEPPSRAQALTTGTDRIIFSRFGVESLYGYIHARLVWLVEMAQLPGAIICLERHVDWALLVDYLNDLISTYDQYERLEMDAVMIAPSGSNDNEVLPRQIPGRTPETSAPNNSETGPRALSDASEVKATDAPTPTIAKQPRPRSVEERPLPEDWKHRGMIYAQNTFPRGWFGDFGAVDDGERLMEMPSMEKIRKERILWLAVRLTKSSTNIVYDKNTHLFSVGEYAADKSIARGKEDDEGGQDDEDDDINLSDMESLAYSANLNIKSTDSVLDHISIKR